MNWLVTLCVAAVVIAVFVSVPAAQHWREQIARFATHIARRRLLAESIVFLFAFALAAIPSLIWSVPLPSEPDEFSYLLAGDTFAHGRLTNPPHAHADALEYADVLMRPTYASKHPPAQGFALAFGQVIAHVPILGVWITGALACAAIVWLMRAVAPPHWALFASLLAATHPLIAWWNQSYWGGNVAMLGGALTFGAVLRMMRRARTRDAFIAGVGLSVLALSRPFEGAILALILGAISIGRLRLRDVIVVAWSLLPVALFLAHYNARVTGDWTLFPHLLHQQRYMIAPRFIWERPRLDLPFASKFMRDFAMIDYAEYTHYAGVANFIRTSALKIATIADLYFPPALLLASLLALRVRSWRLRIALVPVIALPLVHMLIIPLTRAAYFAPVVGATLVVVVAGIRSLAPKLRAIAAGIALSSQIALWIQVTPGLARRAHEGPALRQAKEIARLVAIPGKHLVLVRYAGATAPRYDFVHNGADIENSRIVFARSLDAQRERQTLADFPDRGCWLLTYDESHFSLEPMRGHAP
jgi:hypothetical protein